jgi:hypothetical protein
VYSNEQADELVEKGNFLFMVDYASAGSEYTIEIRLKKWKGT